MAMRDPPDSAVFENDCCREERSSVRAAGVDLVPKALLVPPCRDDAVLAGSPATTTFAERFATTLIRALAAWPT
jgi:hypothetical protein